MGKSWDASGIAFNVEVWREALRVMKPGGHLIAFSGSRTYHRMAVAIEDAGFEIRDQIMWVYGSGFPKSLNIAKSIENKITTGSAAKNGFHKLEGERTGDGRIGMYDTVEEQGFRKVNPDQLGGFTLDATTPEALQWDGWGTALKPAHEPMVLARKPLIGTVANNVLTYGTGGLNIDGSRVGYQEGEVDFTKQQNQTTTATIQITGTKPGDSIQMFKESGRWPANFIHDGSDEVVALFPNSKTGNIRKGTYTQDHKHNVTFGKYKANPDSEHIGDSGSAARFFYCTKASKRDRNEGLDRTFINPTRANHHPTVKPTTLMQYLVRLVTPPSGIVLDPFMGSGSTGKACAYEGFDFIGIDQSAEYVAIAQARIDFVHASLEQVLFPKGFQA
jgi:site-specific DNA-methyltransferase (adenine-specific)